MPPRTGSGCHATLGSSQNFDPITIHAATGSSPNFDPSTGHALVFGRRSNTTTDHVVLGSGTGSDCHATSGSGQNSNPITVRAAVGSGPNSNPSTTHTLGSSRCSDPTIDHTALGFDTRSSPTTGHAALDSDPSSSLTTGHAALGSSPSSGPTTSHSASCNNPTRHAAYSKDLTATLCCFLQRCSLIIGFWWWSVVSQLSSMLFSAILPNHLRAWLCYAIPP